MLKPRVFESLANASVTSNAKDLFAVRPVVATGLSEHQRADRLRRGRRREHVRPFQHQEQVVGGRAIGRHHVTQHDPRAWSRRLFALCELGLLRRPARRRHRRQHHGGFLRGEIDVGRAREHQRLIPRRHGCARANRQQRCCGDGGSAAVEGPTCDFHGGELDASANFTANIAASTITAGFASAKRPERILHSA